MNQNSNSVAEKITIIAEPEALTFATRKEWQLLPDACLGEITQHETTLVFAGTGSIFFLLKNMYPCERHDGIPYRLIKITIDVNGKQVFFIMNLSNAEAAQLMRNRLTIWE